MEMQLCCYLYDSLHLLHMPKSALHIVRERREAVFKIMRRCILQIPVQLQHWLENFAVIVSARGIAAVFLGKATHLNYCCTSSQQLSHQGLSLEKPNKAIPSLLNSMLYFLLKNLLAFFCWFLEVRFYLLVDVEITIF